VDLVHEAVWGQVVVTARVSEMWGGSCLVADHLVRVAAVAAACLQLLVHELSRPPKKTRAQQMEATPGSLGDD